MAVARVRYIDSSCGFFKLLQLDNTSIIKAKSIVLGYPSSYPFNPCYHCNLRHYTNSGIRKNIPKHSSHQEATALNTACIRQVSSNNIQGSRYLHGNFTKRLLSADKTSQPISAVGSSLFKRTKSSRKIHTSDSPIFNKPTNNNSDLLEEERKTAENLDKNMSYSFEAVMAAHMIPKTPTGDSSNQNKTTNEESLNLDSQKNGAESNPDPRKPTEVRIPLPYGHIAAQAWGNPNAKTKILAAHGWLDNSGTFDNLIPLLIDTEDYYVVAYDDIGTGLSSHLPDGVLYDRSLQILTVKRIIKHFEWKEYVLMGHSLGSITLMSYAAIYPNEVKRIISIDSIMPPVFRKEAWQGKARCFLEDGINFEQDNTSFTYEEAVKRIIDGHMRSLSYDDAKTLMKRGARKVQNPGEKPRYIFNRDVRFRTLFLEFVMDKQYLEIYKNIRSHILVLRSTIVDHQQMGDVGSFYKVYKEVAQSFKEELISGTHHIHLGNAEDCSDAIKRWMIQCDELETVKK